MLAKRLLVTIFLIPIGIGFVAAGGLAYALFVTLIIGVAAWEYAGLFRLGGFQPSRILVLAGVIALVMSRAIFGFDHTALLVSLTILLATTWHLIAYERGRDQAATDFCVTLGGVFYLGWLGAYLVSLRFMPEGKWWLLTAMPAVWVADGAAMFIGKPFGRHQLTRRLSPSKTWEGYLGGVFIGTLAGGGMAALWHLVSPAVTLTRGLILGLALSTLTILGDLGESMLKRQVGEKDSGHLLPGHGGIFDRIDSWLWAGVLAYYIIQMYD